MHNARGTVELCIYYVNRRISIIESVISIHKSCIEVQRSYNEEWQFFFKQNYSKIFHTNPHDVIGSTQCHGVCRLKTTVHLISVERGTRRETVDVDFLPRREIPSPHNGYVWKFNFPRNENTS